MRTPAAAIAWEFRRRHRWGLIALASYLLALGTFRLLLLDPGNSVNFDTDWSFALAVMVPMGSAFMYFLALFSFGFAGDLAGRRSIYPARMFSLPVTSGALAGWPMVYGAAAVAVLWLAMRFLAVWPSEAAIPVVWPALFAAVILTWTQALAWMPYALPGLRVIVTVLLMVLIDGVVFLAFYSEASEPVMLALLAPNIPLAYLVARSAVARARRGDAPDRREIFARLGRIRNLLPRRRDPFLSPERAQAWFEWRRHGRSLPVLVGILLPFELSLLFVFRDTPALLVETLIAVLLTPPFLAAFVAATVSRSGPEGSDSHELTPFIAARPLTSASLIAAKLKATILGALAAWMLVLVAVPIALQLSGTSSVVVDAAHQLTGLMGAPRAAAIGMLGLLALMLSTWKRLVQSLYIGLSGRAWLVKASVFVTLSSLTLVVALVPWVIRNGREVIAELWSVLPWILAVLVCFKIAAVARIAVRLHESRLLGGRVLVIGALGWDAAAFALFGLLRWILPALLFHGALLALVAILAVPLARLAAAPLALAWNRHR